MEVSRILRGTNGDRKLIVLPYIDIPVVECLSPSFLKRRRDIKEWANGSKAKMAVAFVAYDNEGEDVDDYFFQIGFVKDDRIVTTKESIKDVGALVHIASRSKEFVSVSKSIHDHVELYFEKIQTVPIWGVRQYYELVSKGRTTRILEGPHKQGGLNKDQRRKVILDDKKNLVYGPLLP